MAEVSPKSCMDATRDDHVSYRWTSESIVYRTGYTAHDSVADHLPKRQRNDESLRTGEVCMSKSNRYLLDKFLLRAVTQGIVSIWGCKIKDAGFCLKSPLPSTKSCILHPASDNLAYGCVRSAVKKEGAPAKAGAPFPNVVCEFGIPDQTSHTSTAWRSEVIASRVGTNSCATKPS